MKSKRPYLLLLAMAIIYNLWLWKANPEEKSSLPVQKKELQKSQSQTIKQ
ncbi:hypothetical protein [Shivajiella indica]|uniref:Uncharacterized protein n=1 Tax=Shivajiella indica TaxID=872115 RepID=A0ABW5B4Y1_9BACT